MVLTLTVQQFQETLAAYKQVRAETAGIAQQLEKLTTGSAETLAAELAALQAQLQAQHEAELGTVRQELGGQLHTQGTRLEELQSR